MPKEQRCETLDEAVAVARKLNGERDRWTWAVTSYPEGVVGPERPEPDGPWTVSPARPYDGRGGVFMMTAEAIRAERREKVLGTFLIAAAVLLAFSLVSAVISEIADPELNDYGFIFGAVFGLLTGLSVWGGYWANQRGTVPLDEKHARDLIPPLSAWEWERRTAWWRDG